MRVKLILITAVLLLSTVIHTRAQNATDELNNYKYVIIPIQYGFQNKENEYFLNTKLKHLLNEKGFTTYMNVEDFPEDLEFNSCLALTAEVVSDSEGFFSMTTQLKILLKDCRNNTLFETEEGMSRKKDFSEGYHEALENAFDSFYAVNYAYNGNVVKRNPAESTRSTSTTTPAEQPANRTDTGESAGANLLEQTNGKTYEYDEQLYGIRKIEAGYLLLDERTGERIALLNQTQENTILYNSDKINGTATLKENGSILVVEYFDTQKGEMQSIRYVEKK